MPLAESAHADFNFTIDLSTVRDNLGAVIKRMDEPCLGASGEAMVAIMRNGPGSVEDAFATGAEFTMHGTQNWPVTKPFGSYPAGATLVQEGRLLGAWLGHEGGYELIDATSVFIGVDTGAFPAAAVFQSDEPTIIKPDLANRNEKSGRLRMQLKLGIEFDVWLTVARLIQGLKNYPRRVGIGTIMYGRLDAHLGEYISDGTVGDH